MYTNTKRSRLACDKLFVMHGVCSILHMRTENSVVSWVRVYYANPRKRAPWVGRTYHIQVLMTHQVGYIWTLAKLETQVVSSS